MMNGNRGITLNGIQYPKSIYTLWSEAERNAIGIYTIEIDGTNKKDNEWYTNTDITYAFSGGKVKGTYGTATAKELADKTVNGVVEKGLKTIKKELIDKQCAGLLAPSDWRVVKATETGGAMDSSWKTWRASVRTKCNSMQTQINNASDVDALAALFTYTEQGDGSSARPLGEFPEKE
jgi:hypothetical protein